MWWSIIPKKKGRRENFFFLLVVLMLWKDRWENGVITIYIWTSIYFSQSDQVFRDLGWLEGGKSGRKKRKCGLLNELVQMLEVFV